MPKAFAFALPLFFPFAFFTFFATTFAALAATFPNPLFSATGPGPPGGAGPIAAPPSPRASSLETSVNGMMGRVGTSEGPGEASAAGGGGESPPTSGVTGVVGSSSAAASREPSPGPAASPPGRVCGPPLGPDGSGRPTATSKLGPGVARARSKLARAWAVETPTGAMNFDSPVERSIMFPGMLVRMGGGGSGRAGTSTSKLGPGVARARPKLARAWGVETPTGAMIVESPVERSIMFPGMLVRMGGGRRGGLSPPWLRRLFPTIRLKHSEKFTVRRMKCMGVPSLLLSTFLIRSISAALKCCTGGGRTR
mmetsp:Transcript_20782/g.65766  ORF Transcript_20782/g.65766 Transcript_20782/m.65766 type:complete len:310 (-) Transcript_20782:1073-2002(-)